MRRKDSRGIDVRENLGRGKYMFDCATEGACSFFGVAHRRIIIAGVTDDCSSVSLLFLAVDNVICVGRDFDGTVHRQGRQASSDLPLSRKRTRWKSRGLVVKRASATFDRPVRNYQAQKGMDGKAAACTS